MSITRMRAYHITHHRNLASICAQGLASDAAGQQHPEQVGIGNSKLKARRMAKVIPGTDTTVGQYVPFYFCPRSVMLYSIHVQNDELAYKEGQEPIIHLVFDVEALIDQTDANKRRWHFTDCNASAGYATFSNNRDGLRDLNWPAIAATQWGGVNNPIKSEKQAELLIFEHVPWSAVVEIGVLNATVKAHVSRAIAASKHQPQVEVRSTWYY